jgi:hypothetical protein
LIHICYQAKLALSRNATSAFADPLRTR